MDHERETKKLKRNAEDVLLATLSDTPAAVIQGARQVGKSTLIDMTASKIDSKTVTLDDATTLDAAKADPHEFVNQYPEGTLAIDELQRCPALLSAIKLSIDENRKPGRFILTGSADLLHVSGANESLAGRAETITLYPFSHGELAGRKEDFVSGILQEGVPQILRRVTPLPREEYAQIVSVGGYPVAYSRDTKRRGAFFQSYLNSVLDHDAAGISGLAHLDKLNELFTVLSGKTSGEIVASGISKMTGIPDSSLHAYLRLLHDLFLIQTLPAWGRNISRRVVSRKKVVLVDTGLASHINRINAEGMADVLMGESFGPLLETYVIDELFKQQTWSDENFSLYHYRDRDRKEVDIVIELFNGRIIALEIKAARSVSRNDFSGLKVLREMVGNRFCCGIVLYTGAEVYSFGEKLFAAPISAVWSL
jgi:predicted AAA+ superfamily ATPase